MKGPRETVSTNERGRNNRSPPYIGRVRAESDRSDWSHPALKQEDIPMRLIRAFIPALLVLALLAAPSAPSNAAVAIGISVGIAPPALPIYEQPVIPGPGYIWTPGYWAWGPEGYYWVPGTWVLPPIVGVLWTPPWWGWVDGVYIWHAGYWGPHIGFYGGINYGFGYSGVGYDGGRWDHGQFFYNREVNNVTNVTNVTNVYSRTVTGAAGTNRVSFNGGTGGVSAQPTAQEQTALREHHIQPTSAQTQHVNAARSNTALLAKTNNGQPPITATSRAGRFNNTGTVATTGTTPRVQGTARTTGAGPTGSTSTTSRSNTRQTGAGPTGSTSATSRSNTRQTSAGPIGSTSTTTRRNTRTTSAGPTGTKGSGPTGAKTVHSAGPTNRGNPPAHVTGQTAHAPVQPKGQPKGQPSGKNQKQPG